MENTTSSLSRREFSAAALASLGTLALGQARNAQAAFDQSPLLEPIRLQDLTLRNRVVMAPLTRGRAGESRTANALMAKYYAQRSGAGLIIAEATAISPQGYGWMGSPGIYSREHAAGWRLVTEAIHRSGGRVVLQLWHTGRVSHPDFLEGRLPVAPSAIAARGRSHTPSGIKPYVVPRAMSEEEIKATVQDYAQAARYAQEAGFDGVEIHAANGYLIDQFIRDQSNRRTDRYGGSIPNRLRFLLEITEAITKVWPARRVGVRLAPSNLYNGMGDSNPSATFTAAATELSQFGLAYLHVLGAGKDGQHLKPDPLAQQLRAAFKGLFMLNHGFEFQTGTEALRAGRADLIAYGRLFISNPDLVERFRRGAKLSEPDTSTFYTSDEKGYTDYPTSA